MGAMTKDARERSDQSKRDRMTLIRQDRHKAGFCEVNVWLPRKYAHVFRDLAWRIVDLSNVALPFRGPRRNEATDDMEVQTVLKKLGKGQAATEGKQEEDAVS